jgi:hypothetical protein
VALAVYTGAMLAEISVPSLVVQIQAAPHVCRGWIALDVIRCAAVPAAIISRSFGSSPRLLSRQSRPRTAKSRPSGVWVLIRQGRMAHRPLRAAGSSTTQDSHWTTRHGRDGGPPANGHQQEGTMLLKHNRPSGLPLLRARADHYMRLEARALITGRRGRSPAGEFHVRHLHPVQDPRLQGLP